MKNIIDLSHPIRSDMPCTFSLVDSRPVISFTEGDSHGMLFITSRIDNLHSNLCTHIDFPGHISEISKSFFSSIGEYPISRFVGKALILDFSFKLDCIKKCFNEEGLFTISPNNTEEVYSFLNSLEKLEISKEELENKISMANLNKEENIIGIIFKFNLGKYWKYKKYESWEYIYFFNGYLSEEAGRYLAGLNLSFVGVDCFQLENPIANYKGDELILIKSDNCRSLVERKVESFAKFTNHSVLLGNDILIYENLNIPLDLSDRVVSFFGAPLNFQIKGLNDNALVRPYVII